MDAITNIQPQPDCYCAACRTLREIEERERAMRVVRALEQQRRERPADIYFGRAAQ